MDALKEGEDGQDSHLASACLAPSVSSPLRPGQVTPCRAGPADLQGFRFLGRALML